MALNRTNLKQQPIPVVPRNMQIVNADGTVTRSGQLLLQQLQAPDAMQGTHAARPASSDVSDGAVYVESDRTVLYANINGNWHYIAGTMWGELNPDQRPTDLGVNDAGFDYRTVDQPAREFIWSGGYWVEVTPVRFGTHAARLAVDVTRVIEQMLWVETDRTVLYQLMQVSGSTPVWQYIAGTMWGTFSPDQRPTDLGTHDAGFDFRTTDAPPREFIWSQTAWIETTPVTGAAGLTHPNVVTKVGATGQIVEGGITDASAGNSGTVQISSAGNVDLTGAIRTKGGSNPTSGVGVEISYQGGTGFVLAYDRTAGAYKPIDLYGSVVGIQANSGAITLAVTTETDITGGPVKITCNSSSNQTIQLKWGPSSNAGFIGVDSSGNLLFANYNTSTLAEFLNNGGIAFPFLPSANPGAGTKQIWYDPTDSNRVKYSP